MTGQPLSARLLMQLTNALTADERLRNDPSTRAAVVAIVEDELQVELDLQLGGPSRQEVAEILRGCWKRDAFNTLADALEVVCGSAPPLASAIEQLRTYREMLLVNEPRQRDALVTTAARQQLVEIAYFDLGEFTRCIKQAQHNSTSRLLAYAVTCLEDQFVTCLCSRVLKLFTNMSQKPTIALGPFYPPVDQQVAALARYRGELERSSVLCLVRAESCEAAALNTFWRTLSNELGQLANYLVLVVTGTSEDVFPPGMTLLPQPTFELADVSLWAIEVITARGWTPDLADIWAELIWPNVVDHNGRVDVRRLYEEIDAASRRVRFEPDELHSTLMNLNEERSCRAV